MLNRVSRKFLGFILLTVIAISLFSGVVEADSPKYVFYFIGDGLGITQRQLTEYFLQEQTGDPQAKLVMNIFPVAGMNTTHSANTLVTDSAAAGTAMATGYKTNNGIIAQLPDGTKLKSLFTAAEEKGMATGLVSTTRLTHATPAVFAANNANRNAENEIAYDFLDSGVDYFAGGGYRHFVPQDWQWGKSKRQDDINIAQKFYEQGYKTFLTEYDTAAFRNYQPKGKEKVLALFTYSHFPYEIDRNQEEVPSLAEMTAKGIEVLANYQHGFILMVEGGRIDHAAHANDPVATIYDTLAFDEAVAEAYEFYQQHPKETLIVVAADHETGGFGLGFGRNYFLKLERLLDVKVSTADVLNWGEGNYSNNFNNDRAAFFHYLAENLGMADLNAEERGRIEGAMAMVEAGENDKIAYGGYDPVAITVAHILSERANVHWTTYAHSAAPVPLSAIGIQAERLGGYKDNTEIAWVLAEILELSLSKK